jgi:hypothetical protein
MKNEKYDEWWRKRGAMIRFSPIESGMTIHEMSAKLSGLAEAGINTVEILPPYFGGSEYGGLDILDFYRVHPGLGTLEDMRMFIETAHNLDIKVTACVNVGYCAVNHPDFIKACQDVKDNRDSRERDFFLWADKPSPLEAPLAPFFLQDADGEWVYNSTAGKYFWCKWFGMGGNTRLPQYRFSSTYFQEECKKMIRFWPDLGFDGLMIDAVNWYADCDWEISRRVIVESAFSGGPLWLQPEGAGGFDDDPVTWITKGGYNCVQDYSLGIFWKNTNLLRDALKSGDTSSIVPALMRCRNPVVAAGGVTYVGLGQGRYREPPPEYTVFETGFLIAAGEMISYYQGALLTGITPVISKLFHLQAEYPALAPGGRREYLEHNCGNEVLAVRCIPESGSGQIVQCILNFSGESRCVRLSAFGRTYELDKRSMVFVLETGEELFSSGPSQIPA